MPARTQKKPPMQMKQGDVIKNIQELIKLWNTEIPVHGENFFEILYNIKERVNARLSDAMEKIKKLSRKTTNESKTVGSYVDNFYKQFCEKHHPSRFIKALAPERIAEYIRNIVIDLSSRLNEKNDGKPKEIKDLNKAIEDFLNKEFLNMGFDELKISDIAKGINTIALGHAEAELQKVYGLSDKEYAGLRLRIGQLASEGTAGPILSVDDNWTGPQPKRPDESNLKYLKRRRAEMEENKGHADAWVDRTKNMVCANVEICKYHK